MGILEDFPTDPFTPSLRFAASNQVPVWMPWGHDSIKLGASLAVADKSHFMDRSAFSQSSLKEARLVFTKLSQGQESSAETSSSASMSEHVDYTIAGKASFAGGLVGASVRAQHEKNVAKNNSDVKRSLRSSYRNGLVTFLHDPELSEEAKLLLQKSQDAFRERFGDYYVAGYVIGGSNANTLGGVAALEASSQSVRGTYEIKIFWGMIKKTGTFGSSEHSESASQVASLAAFDSLSNWNIDASAGDLSSYERMMASGAENIKRGQCVAKRVAAKAGELGLDSRSNVSWDECETICRAGVVVELLLMPYALLREHFEAWIAT